MIFQIQISKITLKLNINKINNKLKKLNLKLLNMILIIQYLI